MGLTEFEAKRALAEKSASRAHCVELLQLIRREKMRAPRAVATFGKVLIDKHSWGLGNELWNVYEQVFIAALDLHDDELAEQCLKALKDKFPGSSRVARLEGMQLEQRGEYAKAEALYAEVLEENPANMLVAKRKIAVLKAQKRTHDVIAALNDFLRSFGTDLSAWTELAETYLSLGAFRYASFCYEELVLLNPMDAIYHSRLADIYSTLGGLDNLRTARKHYSHSIELNKQQNLRAYLGLVACTKAIASHRNYRADQDDNGLNERLLQFALDFLQQFYASQATPELADVAQRALSSF